MNQIERLQQQQLRPATPGEVLDDLLECNGLTITEAAHRLGVGRITVSQIINSRRNLTPDMACRLGRFFGNGPGIWLKLQQNVDLWDMLHGNADKYEDVKPLSSRERELVVG